MTPNPLYRAIGVALAAGALAACGGGGGGGSTTPTGTSSITTVGTLTGFGSVYVNGVRFDTSSASYRVDDDDAFDDSDLAVGMKVKIEGSIDDDGVNGVADSIYYDDDIEGPISNLTDIDATHKRFEIFGLGVVVDADSTVFDDGASFDGLADGQEVEVSGYFDGTDLIASYLELQDDLDDEYEVKGTVTAYDPGNSITIELKNGASLQITINSATVLDFSGDPVGQFVEIDIDDANVALKIEIDDDDLLDDDDDDVEIRGVIAADGDQLLINGVPFVVTDGTEYEPESLEGNLAPGLEVEVEGFLSNGILIAEEVESEDGDIEIEAPVSSVSFTDPKTGVITLDLGPAGTLDVLTNSGTLLKDDSIFDTDDDDAFNLGELSSGQFVEVEAYLDGSGNLIATEVDREDDNDEPVEVEAPLESSVDEVSVTLLGLTWTVANGVTEYRRDDNVIDANTFFMEATPGTTVKLRDDYMADGVADELEIEDDDD